jgi:beta-lactamase regulating signal transducer with metallopeptidase domain
MRLDRANRSFLVFMAITLLLGAFLLCGALGGVLLPLILARISNGRFLAPVHGVASLMPVLLFVISIVVGLGLGARSLLLQTVASRRLACLVEALALAPPDRLTRAAMQTGLAGRVVLVEAADSFSFVYGVLTPRVAVSSGFLEGATSAELRAVLEHEHYHVRNLDPLKVVLVRALSTTLFFLPALESLRARYLAGRELAADRRAVAVCGRRPLAGALLKVVRGPEWSELGVAAAIGGSELLDVRVAQLETGAEPRPEVLSAVRLALSLLAAVILVAAFLASVSSFGGAATVYHVTGTGLATATLLGSLTCAAPLTAVSVLIYLLIAVRASRPLRLRGLWR